MAGESKSLVRVQAEGGEITIGITEEMVSLNLETDGEQKEILLDIDASYRLGAAVEHAIKKLKQ